MLKHLAKSLAARYGMAGAIASAMLCAYPALAQDSRLSLADRVTRLEQQAQRDQGGTGLVNQLQQMQSQLQQLQGQVEELQHRLQQLDDKNKAQYADLDARLARIEGGNAGNGGATGGNNPQAQPGNSSSAAGAATAAGGNSSSSQPAAASSSANTDPAAAQAAYDTAFQSIRAGNYVAAARQFRGFIQQYPNHALVPNAWYWLGQSYFVTTNYAVALDAFKQLVSQYPQSDKLPDAMLKVGYCQIELKQADAAKATLKQVIAKYPGSDSASLAQERLQRLQLQSGN